MFKPVVSLFCGTSLALGGCAGFPHLPGEPSVSISQIITNIECEIQNRMVQEFKSKYWLYEWAAQVTLDIDKKNTGGGSGNVDISLALVPEVLTLNLAATPTSTHNADGQVAYSFYMKDLENTACIGWPRRTESFLTGHTGIADWIFRAAEGVMSTGSCPNRITSSLEFTISIDATGAPKIAGIEIDDPGDTLGLGLSLNQTRKRGHKLSVVLTPIALKDDEANLVHGRNLIEQELGRDFFGTTPPKDWKFSACAIAAAEREGRVLQPATVRATPTRRAPADQVRPPSPSVAPQPSPAAAPPPEMRQEVAPATQQNLDNATELQLLQDLQDELENQ